MKIKTHELAPGCVLVESPTATVGMGFPQAFLVGATPEVVKIVMRQHPVAQIHGLVLADTRSIQGITLMSLEFPLYKFLFVDGGFKRLTENLLSPEDRKKRRFVIIGHENQLAQAREILRITLMGPSASELKRWSRSWAEQHTSMSHRELERAAKEWAFFKLSAFGQPLELDDLVEFRPFKDHSASFAGVNIKHVGHDRYLLDEQELTLKTDTRPKAPFAIVPAQALHAPSNLGVEILSYGNGFDPASGCTSLLLSVYGVRYLVDAAPYVSDMLAAAGVSPDELGGIFLTHVHDDHCGGLLELLECGHKPTLYMTPDVYECLLVKLNAQLGSKSERDKKSVKALFHWAPLDAGSPFVLRGARVLPHRTVHSIPCFGLRVSLDGRSENSVLIVGDHTGPEQLRRMKASGALSEARLNELMKLVKGDEGLVVMDGGGDPSGLHANPAEPELRELARTMGQRLVFGHRTTAVPRAAEVTITKPGARYVVQSSNTAHADGLALTELLTRWGIAHGVATHTLWSAAEVIEVPAQSVICHEGQEPDGFYVILGGTLDVWNNDRPLARLVRGDFFGEMAILDQSLDQRRSATVRSFSAVRLLRIPVDVFACFVHETNLLPQFHTLWRHRELLAGVSLFHDLPASVVQQIALQVEAIEVSAGETVIQMGDPGSYAYVLVRGALEVLNNANEAVAMLAAGALFGEAVALGVASTRTATVRATTCAVVLRLDGAHLRTYAAELLLVQRRLQMLLAERGLADSKAA